MGMKTHQMSHTRFYKIWNGIFTRCYNKNYRLYKDYGVVEYVSVTDGISLKTFAMICMHHMRMI
jgi:hypothetical protein